MANTTNYNWETPDDTDLVKDGALAIRTLGSAVDTTVFNNAAAAIAKSIVDAKGDIIAATAADTVSRLAVGANDTVLTADSSTATGLKWAAPGGASGLTLITRQTVSNAADTGSSFASIFSSTYDTYLVIIEGSAANVNMLHMQLKNAGGNVTSSDYYGNSAYALYNASSFSFNNTNAAAAYNLLGATSVDTRATIWINGVGNASERATWSGNGFEGNNNRIYTFAGEIVISDTFTGLNFKMASGNITLTASVYGLAK